MGNCKYCHKSAGLFRHSHFECEKKFEEGKRELYSLLMSCFILQQDFYYKEKDVDAIVHASFMDDATKEKILVKVLDDAVEKYLEDYIIDDSEKRCIARFVQFSGLSQTALNRHHSLERMLQADVIQDILNGRRPSPQIKIVGEFPFVLARNEMVIWLFRNVTLHEQKIRREYVGRSSGISVRIAKGVYYRTGGFRGHPIETTYMQRVSTGSVCLTDKNIYFSSPQKSLKIPFSKIINIDSYSDGIGLQKDGVNSKPVVFEGIDSWFVYNVIVNLK